LPPPGRYAVLTVSDTGTGMSPETAAHAFDPFFTTKEKGKGTGLGLSTVYGIISQTGGGIALDTAPGKGCTIKIYFPATKERA
jgi:signal transduction histidine kinase